MKMPALEEEEKIVEEKVVMDVVNATLVADDARPWKLAWASGGTILAALDDPDFKERLRANDRTCRFGPGTKVYVLLERDLSVNPRTGKQRHTSGRIKRVLRILQPEDLQTPSLPLDDDEDAESTES